VPLGILPFPGTPSALVRLRTCIQFAVRVTEVRQVRIRYHFFLFTELILIIIILTLPPLSILPRRGSFWAGIPPRCSQWWVAAAPSPPRRATLPDGLASKQRSSSGLESGRRSGGDVVSSSSPHLGVQDVEAATQWGLAWRGGVLRRGPDTAVQWCRP
jgi:hypothetical protein